MQPQILQHLKPINIDSIDEIYRKYTLFNSTDILSYLDSFGLVIFRDAYQLIATLIILVVLRIGIY